MAIRITHLLPLLALLGSASPFVPGLAQSASEGHRLASASCARCHVVERNGGGSWTDAPSFQNIANRPGVTRAWLSGVVLASHAKMSANSYNLPQANSIADYILSLRQR